jgi:hypothetical protein
MSRLTEVSPKYEDHYFAKTVLIDHCQEVVDLYRAWKVKKIYDGTVDAKLTIAIRNGMADLLLLLEELVPPELAEKRLEKWAANANRKQ